MMTIRDEPQVFVPPLLRSEVRPRTRQERDAALFFDHRAQQLPIGISRAGEPLYLNPKFLDGAREARVNSSGVSRMATNTTYATLLLYSLFSAGVLAAEAVNTKTTILYGEEDLICGGLQGCD